MTDTQPGVLRRILYLCFSLAVTVGVFSYLFSHVSLAEVLELVVNSNKAALGVFVVLSLLMSLVRLWRYRLVLRTSGHSPGSLSLFLVVLVRNFFSDLLPARLGTLVYVYIVVTRLGIPFAAAGTSFALAFLFDIIALAPMLLLAALFAMTAQQISGWLLLAGGALVTAVACGVLFALGPGLRLGRRLLESRKGRMGKLRSKLLEHWTALEDDMETARSAGILGRLFFLSVGVRGLKYGALYVLLYALVQPLGYTLAQLSVPKVFLGICASELAASLPISGIAGFGAYEGTWALVFNLIGFDSIAEITSISHHLITQVYGYSLGAVAALLLLLPVFKVQTGETDV